MNTDGHHIRTAILSYSNSRVCVISGECYCDYRYNIIEPISYDSFLFSWCNISGVYIPFAQAAKPRPRVDRYYAPASSSGAPESDVSNGWNDSINWKAVSHIEKTQIQKLT